MVGDVCRPCKCLWLAAQGLGFTGIVVRTPTVPNEELCVCGANRVCESQDCSTVVYPMRWAIASPRGLCATPCGTPSEVHW